MIVFLFIAFLVCLICSVWVAEDKASRFGFSLVSSIFLLGIILEQDERITVKNENHVGYNIDTIYTVKNNVRVGVTYHVSAKKK